MANILAPSRGRGRRQIGSTPAWRSKVPSLSRGERGFEKLASFPTLLLLSNGVMEMYNT